MFLGQRWVSGRGCDQWWCWLWGCWELVLVTFWTWEVDMRWIGNDERGLIDRKPKERRGEETLLSV